MLKIVIIILSFLQMALSLDSPVYNQMGEKQTKVECLKMK